MKKIKKSIQKAPWIWSAKKEENSYVGFVREFSLKEVSLKAELALFTDTHYKLYVNGHFINAGPAPFRKPDIQIDSYDISAFLKRGENHLFILAHYVGFDIKYNRAEEPGVLACLSLKEGRVTTDLLTNKHWQAFPLDCWQKDTVKKNWAIGMVEAIHCESTSYKVLEYYASEDYGCPLNPVKKKDFLHLKQTVICTERPDLNLKERMVPYLCWSKFPPVDLVEIFRTNAEVYLLPDSIRLDNEYLVKESDNRKYQIRKSGHARLTRGVGERGYSLLYDMLRMTAGDISLEIEVESPCIVDIQYTESVRNGRPYGTRQGSHWYGRCHLKKGHNSIRLYHFCGFRYLYLVCKDFMGEMNILGLTAHECRGDLNFSDRLITPDSLINDIYDISRRSIMLNAQANTYDCNTREQGTYWGDSIWITHSIGLMTGNFSHMKHLCHELPNEYRANKFIGASLYGLGAPLYDFCLVPIDLLNRYFICTGDRNTVEAALKTCEAIIQNFRELKDRSGFINLSLLPQEKNDFRKGFVFLDHPGTTWHPRQTTAIDRDDYNAGINLFYLKALKALKQLYVYLFREENLSHEIEELTLNIRSYFYDSKKGLLYDSRSEDKKAFSYSQITNALAIMTDVLEGQRAVYALEAVCDTQKNSFIAKGTPYSYFFIAQAAIHCGETNLALQTIKRDYEVMVRRGATTTWEAFGGENHDSLNHAWSAVLPYLVITGIAGISAGEPGYGEIHISPDTTFFDEFSLSVPMAEGAILVQWKRRNPGEVDFHIKTPRAIRCFFTRNGKSYPFDSELILCIE